MLENKTQPLLSRRKFIWRMVHFLVVGMSAIIVALFLGMAGYHHFASLAWDDAFVNAAMILSGMGPVSPLVTESGMMFAGFYALFSGLFFITVIGLMFTPVLHRLYHKFHLD